MTTQAGSNCGLRLVLWTNQSDYLAVSSSFAGFRVSRFFYCTTMNWNDQGFNCDFNWISVKVSQMTQLYAEMWTLLQERKIEHNIIQRTRREVSYANTKGMSWVLVIRASSSRPKHLANGGQNTSPPITGFYQWQCLASIQSTGGQKTYSYDLNPDLWMDIQSS